MRAAIFIVLYFKIGKPNSRHLETLSMAVLTSPALFKQRVGNVYPSCSTRPGLDSSCQEQN